MAETESASDDARPPSRWRAARLAVTRLTVGLILLGLLLSLALYAALESPRTRQWLFGRVAGKIEAATGLRVEARDFSLALSAGTLTVEELRVGTAPGTPGDVVPPILTARRVEATVSWRSLFADRIRVERVRVEAPRLDLQAPRPEPRKPEPTAEPSGPPAVDAYEITISEAEVSSGPLPEDVETWLDSWRVEQLDLEGTYLADRLAMRLPAARLTVESARRPPIVADLRADAELGADGTFSLGSASLTGDGLDLRLSGRGELTRQGPFDFQIELDADPPRLFPDLTRGGLVDVRGDVALADRVVTGDLRLDVRELPGELLIPGLLLSDSPQLDLTGTIFDVAADLRAAVALDSLDTRPVDALGGTATLGWSNERERLVTASVEALELSSGVGFAFDAALLPDEAESRRVAGELRAPGWIRLAEGELRRTRLDVTLPDLGDAVRRLGASRVTGDLQPAGALWIQAGVAGPLAALELESTARWQLDGEPLVTADWSSAGGLGRGRPLELALAAEILPETPGHIELSGELLAPDAGPVMAGDLTTARLRNARLDLALSDPAAATSDLRRLWQRLVPGRELPAALAEGGISPALLTGELRFDARGDGPLLTPDVELEALWLPAGGERVQWTARGRVQASPPYLAGDATTELVVAALDLGRFEADGVAGRLDASLDLAGAPRDHRAYLTACGSNLRFGEGIGFDRLELEAFSDGEAISFDRLDASTLEGRPLSGHGRIVLAEQGGEPLIQGGRFTLELPRPAPELTAIERVVIDLGLDAGTVTGEVSFEETGQPLRPVATARVPLGALDARPELGEALAAVPVARQPGEIWIALAGLELEPFLPYLELGENALTPHATFEGSLTLDLADPTASTGTLDVSEMAVENAEGRLAAEETLRIVLEDRRLELLPARLIASISGARGLVASGRVELGRRWQLEDGVEALVENLDFTLDGTFDTSQLNPLLAGGAAQGNAHVRLKVLGPLDGLTVEGVYESDGSSIFYATPYLTRLEAPRFRLTRLPGGAALEEFSARLNGGTVTATGLAAKDQGIDLKVELDDVRYRVDYGLSTRSSGRLHLVWPAGEPRGRLSGEIVVERGTLSRDLDLDRNLRSLLFAPDLTSTEGTELADALDLDLSVISAEGVRIKNNLADLRADWNRLRIRGTLQNPLISGRIEVDPGGKLSAYGQQIRLDEASVSLSGDPLVSPRVVLETTSSFDDPSVRQSGRGLVDASLGEGGPGAGSYWDQQRPGEDASVSGELTGGLVTYYSDQIAGSLARGLKGTELSLEPLPIFGETDTQARLTATYRASPNADLIYSVNPRDAEGQTYLLDLHDFDFAPSVTAQVFTNDSNNQGFTLVHRLERGGGPEPEKAPRLREIELVTPEGISRRRLRKAYGLREGDPFPEDGAFDVELDVVEELRRQGFPGGSAQVEVSEAPRSRLDLGIVVEAGPAVDFVFEGDTPPRRARRLIVQAYRTLDETTALAEVESETVKALREQGFLHPEVSATVEHQDPADANAPRTVRIHAAGGRKIDPEHLEIEGVEPDVAAGIAALFTTRLNRVELAAGVPGADNYLIRSLRALGYGDARITSRELSEDGERLLIRVEPGELDRVGRVEIAGVPEAEAERLRAGLPPGVAPGQPARSDRITRAVHGIEDDLRARGYSQADVRTHLEPLSENRPHELRVRFTITAGPLHHLDAVEMEGLQGTRPAWASRVAGLSPGTVFNEQDLDEARLRLWRTGLFDRVRTRTETQPTDDGEAASREAASRVVFELEEKPRFLFAYGGRWENNEGFGLVFDAIDRNFLGRGTTLGLRAIYAGDDDRSLRFYHVTPRVRGSKSTLEVFLEGKTETTEDLLVDSLESWAQLTFPLSRRTQNRVYFRYQDLSLADLPSEDSPLASTEEQLRIPSFGWQLTWDTRERAFGSQRADGSSFGLDLTLTDKNLASDFTAFGLFAQLKRFDSFAFGSSTGSPYFWAQSLRGAFLEPFEDERVPFLTRLRAGGEYSVRGYRTESLGPLADDGTALGGEVLLILNEEFHFPLWGETLRGLLFFDAGNVWESSDALDSEIFKSLGLGLRASTPAGPLRLDVAFPLDRREGIDDEYKIYVGFGNVF